jgi:hypothetical protein
MNLIELFLTLQNQIKIYHWQTEKYSEHKAFDKSYESLSDLIDQFIEIYMGKNGRLKAKGKFNISLENYDGNVNGTINAYIDVFTNDLPKALEEKDTDLLNVRDEMLGELNQLLYLLTLN